MADTGFNWGAWAFVKNGAGGDWDTDALADNAAVVSNTSISLDVIAACEVGFDLIAGAGGITGVVTVFILGDVGGMADEEITADVGSPWKFTIMPVASDNVYKRFMVDPGLYGSFKVAIINESGQQLTISVKVRTATIPAAS